jgi:L,D-peptidoglycan transpeptidase YkuD (ErfK/YbiS/YcfS/YnhG family)
MWRADELYDYVVVLDHNQRPRVRGRGSAIFLHAARPGYPPTEGCIAVAKADMMKLLLRLGPRTRVRLGR